MRNRAWRRAQNKRVVSKRLGIIKNLWKDSSYKPFPGHLRKWNFTCDCGMCKMSRYYGRVEKSKREIARAPQVSDYI